MPSMTPQDYVRLRLRSLGKADLDEMQAVGQVEAEILAQHRAVINDDMDYDERMKQLRIIVQNYLDRPKAKVKTAMLPPAPVRKAQHPLPTNITEASSAPLFPPTPALWNTTGQWNLPPCTPMALLLPMTPTNTITQAHNGAVLLSPVFPLVSISTGNTVKEEPQYDGNTDSDSDSGSDSDSDSGSESEDEFPPIDLSGASSSAKDSLLIELLHRVRNLEQLLNHPSTNSNKSRSRISSRHPVNPKRRGGATRYSEERKRILVEAYEQQIALNQIDDRGHVQLPGEAVLEQLSIQAGLSEASTRKWWANRVYSKRKKEKRQEKREQEKKRLKTY